MMLRHKKGFIIILVTVALSVVILSTSVIVVMGCNELLATRLRNDLLVSAYYVAISGCELMYAHMKTTTIPIWPVSLSDTISVVSVSEAKTITIGTYSATAYEPVAGSNEFYIVSNGIVNGHTATATVKLGCFTSGYSGTYSTGSYGAMTLTSGSNQAKIVMEGPAASHETVTETLGGKIDISGDPQTINGANLPKVTFWKGWHQVDGQWQSYDKETYDTNGDGAHIADTNNDGKVDINDVPLIEGVRDPGLEAIFKADTVYHPGTIDATIGEIDEKDAFYRYYTYDLNSKDSLTIGPGQQNHKDGDQIYGTSSILDSVPIIFIDGNAKITINDGATTDHTVVVTGNLELIQPSNGPGDRNTYVVYGNVDTYGEMGSGGGTKGDLIIFANGNITKLGGGKMNVSLYANGTLTIDTAGDTGKLHLMLSKLTNTLTNNAPLGLPPTYPTNIYSNFYVKNQSDYPPIWQRAVEIK